MGAAKRNASGRIDDNKDKCGEPAEDKCGVPTEVGWRRGAIHPVAANSVEVASASMAETTVNLSQVHVQSLAQCPW